VRVIEGSIAEIKIQGDEADRYGLYPILQGLLRERPSRLASVERKLLIANDTPGLRITDTGIEELGKTSGRFRLTLKVKTWRIYTTLGLDNSGSKAVGPLQGYSSTYFNSIFVGGDALGLNLSTVPDSTRDLRAARLTYDTPLGTDGIKIGASASYSEVWPNDVRRDTDTRTINESYQLRGSFAPLQTRAATISLFATLNVTNEEERNSFGLSYSDRVRFVRVGIDGRVDDPLGGSNYATLVFRQGLDIWGATKQMTLSVRVLARLRIFPFLSSPMPVIKS
jgi:hemolysin activation/secretion protein